MGEIKEDAALFFWQQENCGRIWKKFLLRIFHREKERKMENFIFFEVLSTKFFFECCFLAARIYQCIFLLLRREKKLKSMSFAN